MFVWQLKGVLSQRFAPPLFDGDIELCVANRGEYKSRTVGVEGHEGVGLLLVAVLD